MMKALLKILYFLLGIIVVLCIIILLTAINPQIAEAISDITSRISKKDIETTVSTEGTSNIDIDTLLKQIEEREQQKKVVEEKTIDLGLVDSNIYESLDDYYGALINVIKENYRKDSVLNFSICISESVFSEWYLANYTESNAKARASTSFSYDVNYEKQNNGCYLIAHTIIFQ